MTVYVVDPRESEPDIRELQVICIDTADRYIYCRWISSVDGVTDPVLQLQGKVQLPRYWRHVSVS